MVKELSGGSIQLFVVQYILQCRGRHEGHSLCLPPCFLARLALKDKLEVVVHKIDSIDSK